MLSLLTGSGIFGDCRYIISQDAGSSGDIYRPGIYRPVLTFIISFNYYEKQGNFEDSINKVSHKGTEARYDLTQEQLADLVDARRETIGHIESGRYNPSLILAYKITRALKSNIEDVFTFEEK